MQQDESDISATKLENLLVAGNTETLLDIAHSVIYHDYNKFIEILQFLATHDKETALKAWLDYDGLAKYAALNSWLPMVADPADLRSLAAAWDWIKQSFPLPYQDRALLSFALYARDKLPNETLAHYATLSDGEIKDGYRSLLISRYTRNHGPMVAEQLVSELISRPHDQMVIQDFKRFCKIWHSASPEACLSMLKTHLDAAAFMPDIYQDLLGN